MSSGESGDESSGIESPGPSGLVVASNGGGTSSNSLQLASDSNNSSIGRQIINQIQVQHQPSDEPTINNKSGSNINSSMSSVLYPAAALANLPQEVLLSLVQAGHLQVHQEEAGE